MPDATALRSFCISFHIGPHRGLWRTICKIRLLCLSARPRRWTPLLRGLPETWTHHNEGDGTFTVVDVVGHLIYADRVDWMPRAQKILAEARRRPPISCRSSIHSIAGDMSRKCRGKTLPQLLDEFRRVRTNCLEELRSLNLQPKQLNMRGRHPSLGAVTLSNFSPRGPHTI